MRRIAAFTMLEMLVVLALIVLVAGVLFPVISSAKTRSKHSVDISNLHQIVMAAHLYSEQGGALLASPTQLVESGLAPATIFRSPLDSTREGQANLALRLLSERRKPAQFPVSYTSVSDFSGPDFAEAILQTQGAGLYVSLNTLSRRRDEIAFTGTGTYLRALTDGAIVYRTVRWDGEGREKATNVAWLFTDDVQQFPLRTPKK